MSDVVSLARRVGKIEASPQFSNYSKVIINVSDTVSYVAGDDTGRTLEIDNPFGTQAMANAMLASLSGYQYQPYTATDALLDPAAEIGDAANMRGAYGGIYQRQRRFTPMMPADIAAPQDEEINHEYEYVAPEQREFTRSLDEVKASLIVANDAISAKVSQTGGNNSSFGWVLNSSSHKWYAGNKEVMSVSATGLTVKGTIEATAGKIGNFNIAASAIWNNISSFGATSPSSGVYIGTNGIQLGQAFKVTPTGQVTATNISANNMTLTGTLNIGGSTITAAALRSGAQSAYSNGGAWTRGAGYGDNYHTAVTAYSEGSGLRCNYFYCSSSARFSGALLAQNGISVGAGGTATWKSATINGVTINYLGR